MYREYEEEKIFAEKLDRLLTAGETSVESTLNEDLKTALEFARKMTDLRPIPSSQFQANLKARLLQKLNEQENHEEARKGWFWKLIPREPAWQVVAVLAIVVLVGGVVWGTLFRTTPPQVVSVPQPTVMITAPAPKAAPATSAPAGALAPAATTAPAASPRPTAPATAAAPAFSANQILTASASTNKPSYTPADSVNISLSLQNVTSQTLTIQEFPPIVSLMQASTKLPVYTFAAGKTSKTLTPGEKTDYVLTWNQLDAKGGHVAPGEYYIELEELYYQGHEVPLNLSKPVYFDILN